MNSHFFQVSCGIVIFLFFIAFGWETTFASVVLFDPKEARLSLASSKVDIRLNTEERTINAVEGRVQVPKGITIREIQDGGSLIQYWIKRPAAPQCESGCDILFSGIIPGGYLGNNGLLFSLIATAQEGNSASGHIVFHDLKVLLHDGSGTPDKVNSVNLTYVLSNNDTTNQEVITPDTTPPEPFVITLSRDPQLFEGQWFIAFIAFDRGSGIDHNEVCEHHREGNHGKECLDQWLIAESPYQLKNQTLQGVVTVQAIDRRGNVRIASIRLGLLSNYEKYLKWIILGIGGGLAIAMTRGKVWSKLKSHRE